MSANPLNGLTVLNADRDSIPLFSLWARGPAVFAFVRHFG
jgi:hypothetical protein